MLTKIYSNFHFSVFLSVGLTIKSRYLHLCGGKHSSAIDSQPLLRILQLLNFLFSFVFAVLVRVSICRPQSADLLGHSKAKTFLRGLRSTECTLLGQVLLLEGKILNFKRIELENHQVVFLVENGQCKYK